MCNKHIQFSTYHHLNISLHNKLSTFFAIGAASEYRIVRCPVLRGCPLLYSYQNLETARTYSTEYVQIYVRKYYVRVDLFIRFEVHSSSWEQRRNVRRSDPSLGT